LSSSLIAPTSYAADGLTGTDRWVEPGTAQCYPLSFGAYRRMREAEDKPLSRHRAFGQDIDHWLPAIVNLGFSYRWRNRD